jgi:TetR/AcrR family transcriptional repressor of bet genes
MGAAIQDNPDKVRRKASKDVRRQQLIDATIDVIARKGYASLTIADVARTAGLSVGIISFHFEGKEKLLAASLRMLAEEYYQNWKTAIDEAGNETAKRLEAILLSDFNESIYTPAKIAAWIAFWGESQGRPVYEEICSSHDIERSQVVLAMVQALTRDGNYDHDPRLVTFGLEGICEGLWLGTISTAARIDPYISGPKAKDVVKAALHAYFPGHYGGAKPS